MTKICHMASLSFEWGPLVRTNKMEEKRREHYLHPAWEKKVKVVFCMTYNFCLKS
jgi:hypothetical protein